MKFDRRDPRRLHAAELATEYGVSEATMDTFLCRFAPSHVEDDRYKADSDTMLFVHIPKTAGVSVGKAFQQSFDRFYSVQWDNIGPSFRQSTRAAAYEQTRQAGRQVIMGHFGWPEIQVWRNHEMPAKCGAIFRDPASRMVSNFNYNSSSAHPGRASFIEKFPDLETYVKDSALDFQITQAVGFVSSFEQVLAKLNKYYTFLGVTEGLASSLRHLSASHGLPRFSVHRENVGKSRTEQIDRRAIEMIDDRSHNDRKLHRLICRIYQLPSGRIEATKDQER